jgi:hypothetical protein
MLAPAMLHLFILCNACPLTNSCESFNTIGARQEFSKHSLQPDLITINSNLLQSYQFVLSNNEERIQGLGFMSDDTKCVMSDSQMCPEIDKSVNKALMMKQAQDPARTTQEISALQSEIRKQSNTVMFLTWVIYFYIFITIQLEL